MFWLLVAMAMALGALLVAVKTFQAVRRALVSWGRPSWVATAGAVLWLLLAVALTLVVSVAFGPVADAILSRL